MVKITQKEFDALLRVNGWRICPSNVDYSLVNSFGEGNSFGKGNRFGEGNRFGAYNNFGADNSFGARNSFGEGNRFGAYNNFGENNRFGARNNFGEGCKLEKTKPLIGRVVYYGGGYGSEGRTTYAIPMKSGVYVRCGCWAGSLKEFRERVEKVYQDNPIQEEYLLLANLFEVRWKREINRTAKESQDA